MSPRRRLNSILMIIGLVIVVGFLAWAFMQGRKEAGTGQVGERPAKLSPRVSVQHRENVITLDKEAQVRSGIAIASLKPISYREELQAYGTVLELQSLVDLRTTLINLRKTSIDLRNSYAAAKSQVEKTRASLDASSKQYERLKALYEDNRNVSAKAFQAAEATWRSDQAACEAAQEALNASQKSIEATGEALQALEDSGRQQWGPIIAKWLFDNSPVFDQLFRQQTLLIQITLPSGVQISSGPKSVRVQAASGTALSANFVSLSPRTDPRIQGMSFFYMAPTQVGFLQGMNVRAYLPVGKTLQGVLVPAQAIVWWQGKARIYMQRNAEQFVRRDVSTETPFKDGYFVVKGFKAGDQIVVKGAQLLLSEESRSRVQGNEEED